MRLVSYGPQGNEQAGILDGESIIPLHSLDAGLGSSVQGVLAPARLDQVRSALAARGAKAPRITRAGQRLGPPVATPSKIVCIGLNFKGHADEQKLPHPVAPLLFAKAPSALSGCADPIVLPDEDDARVDYEVELVAVIGTRASSVSRTDALKHVAGYMVANDVSARRAQRGDGQWFRGKSCDTFFPCGPWLLTADAVGDIAGLRLTTTITGSTGAGSEVLQDALAGELIHDVPGLVSYISRFITLLPGDLISTGTPAGVGMFRTPQRWLLPGDTVRCSISSATADLGSTANVVQQHPARQGA